MVVEIGLKATEAEDREITQLFNEARNTPVIVLHTGQPDLASRVFERMNKRIHAIVMSHGFPEIPGYYGYDGRTRQFTRWEESQPQMSETIPGA
jgi:hypothetical protein